ncbi:MAG: thioredoxin domain-containing protein [Bacteroidia bacterium]
MDQHKFTNNLIHSSSPYLLQHAHNPVNWFEWSVDAFEKAKREDKLVLVSIGYSACHWCHVMERECFEIEDTARLMNENFVCIKVDREERPDVDQVYMDAVQLLTGQGGWPLNCFTLPDGRPIHGGTYFPKYNWESVLEQLSEFYKNNKERAIQHAEELTSGIKKMDILNPVSGDPDLNFEKLSSILTNCKKSFDFQLGGFNRAPKFPLPNNWEMFLQFHHFTKDEEMKNAIRTTLTKMAEGGINDQVGGGFARYSTDSYWKVPHFEKMLYDNAQLMSLYSLAYQQSKSELYKKVVYRIHEFIARELTSPEGYFYSALDADSEGVEGKFYVWTQNELKDLLGDDEPLFSLYFSVDKNGNWEHGNNILYKILTDDEIGNLTGKNISEIELIISKCTEILLQARFKRIKPGLDDKMITSWNALMIKGYAEAYVVFNDAVFLNAAKNCADFILEKMLVEKELYRIYKKVKRSIPAFAEDHAALCEALILLYEASTEEKYIVKAKELMEISIRNFYEEDNRLFYFKSKNDTPLIARKIDVYDNVIPSANSIFAKCLYKLGFLFDKENYHRIAQGMIKQVQLKMETYPTGYSNWIQLLMWMRKGFYQVIVTGRNSDKELRELREFYLPNAIILSLKEKSAIPLLMDKVVSEETKIYVCRDKVCGLPLHDTGEITRKFNF